MNILPSFNSPQKNNNRVSFCAQKIFNITLEKTLFTQEKVPLDAHFSRLERSDVFELFPQRSKLARSEYGFFIFRDLVRKLRKIDFGTDFFMIEEPLAKTPYNKIKGLASIFNGKNWTEIINLQAFKEYDDSISGVGSNLLCGICELAKIKGHYHIELDAAGEHLFDYYRNLGFRQAEMNPYRFYLTDQDYDSFIKNIKSRYNKETICAQN